MTDLPKLNRDEWMKAIEEEREQMGNGPAIQWTPEQDDFMRAARCGRPALSFSRIATMIAEIWRLEVVDTTVLRRCKKLGLK